jgi:hypothetical protein
MQAEKDIQHIGRIIIDFDSDGRIIYAGGRHIVRRIEEDGLHDEEISHFIINPYRVVKDLAEYIDWCKDYLKAAEEHRPTYSLRCMKCNANFDGANIDKLLKLIEEHLRTEHKHY